MKQCFIILGMHRSGTSVTTGILSHFDLSLGQDLIKPNEENPKGFFENKAILALNKRILRESNSDWDDYHFNLENCDKSKIKAWISEAIEIIKNEFSEHKIFAIKDPRICLLYPIWEQALKKLKIKIKVIISYRHPGAVAYSLETRNKFNHNKSVLLWARYFFSLEKYSRKHERLLLIYPTDFQDASTLLSTLEEFTESDISKENKQIALDFYDQSLTRHQKDPNEAIKASPSIIHEFISLIETQGIQQQDKINALFVAFDSLLTFFSNQETIIQKNSQLSRKSTEIRQRNERIKRLDFDINELESGIAEKLNKKTETIDQLQLAFDDLKKIVKKYSDSTSEEVHAYLRDRKKNAWLKGMYKHNKDRRLLQRIEKLQSRIQNKIHENTNPKETDSSIKKKSKLNIDPMKEIAAPLQQREYWESKINASKLLPPLTIAFAITDEDNRFKEYKYAKELAKHFKSFGWKTLYLKRLEGQWYELNPTIDILISFSDSYNLSKIQTANDKLISIAWITEWFSQWKQLPYLERYKLIGTPDLTFAKEIKVLPNNQLLKSNDLKNFAQEIKTALKRRLTQQTISLKIPARTWKGINSWGDYHFAVLLKHELEKQGYCVFLHVQSEWYCRSSMECDISFVLRGLRQHAVNKHQINIIWNISHPNTVTLDEYNEYDHVFIASTYWAKELSKKLKVKTEALLQCTDTKRFHPPSKAEKETNKHELLFVGNSRGIFRKILKDLMPTKYDLAIYGEHDNIKIPKKHFVSTYLSNTELYKYYGATTILLNDHWDDMKEKGFISNRIYDGLASGAFIISDEVREMGEIKEHFITYKSPKELKKLVNIYINNPEKREDIIKSGPNYIQNNHTFDIRAKQISNTIQKLIKKKH